MADNDKKTDDVIDIETLSDEEFLKLDVPPLEVADPKTEENGDAADADKIAADAAAEAAGGGDASTGADTGDGENGQEGPGSEGAGEGETGEGTPGAGEPQLTEEEQATETARVAALSEEERAAEVATAEEEAEAAKVAAAEEAKTKKVNDDKETLKLKNAEPTKEEAAATELAEQQEVSDDFFKKVSAPFKADGKEVQVRTPEEAIRLMQMGVNYSKRMQEMKPLRAMDAMLTAHGLNDPEKLNELIDLSKGSVQAINKYLKKHNIDPLDLDASKGDEHTTPNYRSDPKDQDFQDAINTTLEAEGGKELLADINADWDTGSKDALRENPSIFGKLLDQKDTGVYRQIQKELLHQKNMGYLANVPYLKAYEQVGNAMQKAGVFDTTETSKKTGLAPIHSGSRKSATPKTVQTTPNLSSTSTTIKPATKVAPTEPDYLSMSDADFMNLAPPS